MTFPTLITSHSLPILRTYTQLFPDTSTSTTLNSAIYAKLLQDIENEAYLKIIKALQNCDTISYHDMVTIKHTIWTRLRLITAWNKTKKRNMTAQLPLVVGTTRDIVRKIAYMVDASKEPRWALHPKIKDLDICGLSDDQILIEIRHVLSSNPTSVVPISKSEANKVADFVAQGLPENFALSRKQILQLIGVVGGADVDGRGKFEMVEVKKGLEELGEGEVLRLLKGAETDGRAAEQIRLAIRDVRVKNRLEEGGRGR